MSAVDERVETAAQLIHNTHHRAGTAGVCGECRDLARQVADVLDAERLHQIEQRARAIFDDPQPNNWRGAAFHILTGDIDE